MVMTLACAQPGAIKIKNLRGERKFFRIAPERIIDADEKLLCRQYDGTTLGIVAGEELGLFVEDLGSEKALLESDDLGHLIGRWRRRCLRMAKRGIDCLVFKRGLAAIPHDCAQEAHIGSRQGAPVNRDDAGLSAGPLTEVAAERIIVHCDRELIRHRNAEADAN